MNPVRIAILVVAAIAAVMVALLLRNVSAKPKAPPPTVVMQQPKFTTRVLVASHDLPVGVRLGSQDMTWQPWPTDSINGAYITDGVKAAPKPAGVAGAAHDAQIAAKDVIDGGGAAMQSLQGAVVRSDIAKGEPIVAGKLVRAGDGGYMSVVLKPGMRAMAVPVSAETGAGGFIQPGDRVDVMQSFTDQNHKGPGNGVVDQIVVSNARVLAVDQSTEPPKNGRSAVAATITLEVPADAAPLITEAKTRGSIMLALRSYADMAGGPGHASVAGATPGMRLIKGGQITEVAVSR
ncbi:Flp pilus assembly protein CpaB [Caulobacter sp. KR2-114]|uniref:Flp pilus assembly protein CpaB n=1 Tax=Caulobacter sp. KR2-114 TaxID=3400912 RepID=UPI003C029296